MKKIFLAILLLVSCCRVFAQKEKLQYITTFDDKRIHFGFTLGMNTLDFMVENYLKTTDIPGLDLSEFGGDVPEYIRCDVPTLVPGFTVGIVSSFRLNEYLNLRFLPGLSFGERQLTYNIPIKDIYSTQEPEYYTIRSTFLDFPLLIKYKAKRINNDRPYIVFGGAVKQDISRTAQEDLVKLNKTGFYAEIGGGWDHYFVFFRLSVEAKFSFGLNNQLGGLPDKSAGQKQYYSQSIKSLRSKVFTLSFHFE